MKKNWITKFLGIVVLGLFTVSNTHASVWSVSESKNEFEGTTYYYIKSKEAPPNKKLNWPYSDALSTLVVGCDKYQRYWIYFHFDSVNLKWDDFTIDGDPRTTASVKYGEEIEGINIYFETGSNFVFVSTNYEKEMFKILSENNSIMVQFDHYGDGKRHYKFNTSEFSKIFNQTCKYYK